MQAELSVEVCWGECETFCLLRWGLASPKIPAPWTSSKHHKTAFVSTGPLQVPPSHRIRSVSISGSYYCDGTENCLASVWTRERWEKMSFFEGEKISGLNKKPDVFLFVPHPHIGGGNEVLETSESQRAITLQSTQQTWNEANSAHVLLLHVQEETGLKAAPRASSHRAGMTNDSGGAHLVTSPWPAQTAGGVRSSGKAFSLPPAQLSAAL